ncbi:anhydro-N-acetylmuramic acid kinase [Fervidibacter sacchari]|uniref:Anhydro-N-acetylmuramic acid kinase n=1 Tax=Candidatus Fervidibacter sacchari TaxID=1448929 RepID=A0ABT2EJH9_9BACT|nr:anhydro-N-acetylmuramic acid kinase [Candidatus Fervidibacter sacchari]MCS3918112.1 anhydro-N-acetylmuramic acid kinase [Candidatus Fervidibacter sacchari]WKU15919.1 anhydro-N-acetylmuramic acid kinase [Candidatus Fervidibacter sacchari]
MLPKSWRWLEDYAASSERLIVGLISGTSADGVDAALVRVIGDKPKRVETLAFTTLPYPAKIRKAVLEVSHNGDIETLCWLNFALGELFAEAALKVIEIAGVDRKRVQLIGSHGQTVRHLPPNRKHRTTQSLSRIGTLQIASPAVIAMKTGIPVVSDFRAKDMAVGGQGAPLVPLVDWLLLRHSRKTRIALNIGGIANLTVLPAKAKANDVLAFDTGPGNMLIDGAVRHFSGGALNYDRNGEWARQGRVDKNLLRWLMSHPFLRQPPPKSTGREMFGDAFLREVLERAKLLGLTERDTVATLTAFTAESIADAIRRFVLPKFERVDELIVSGGGANNPILMAMLHEKLPRVKIRRSDELGINADAKEAIAFAILAHRTVMGFAGNLPSATGAKMPVILGSITLPR